MFVLAKRNVIRDTSTSPLLSAVTDVYRAPPQTREISTPSAASDLSALTVRSTPAMVHVVLGVGAAPVHLLAARHSMASGFLL